jgi:hypothetical protein
MNQQEKQNITENVTLFAGKHLWRKRKVAKSQNNIMPNENKTVCWVRFVKAQKFCV